MNETLEGEIVEQKEPGTALEVRPAAQIANQPAWTPSFVIPVDEMVQRVEAKHDFFRRVMRSDQHYGLIPGAGTKPALFKSGAELLLSAMGLYAEFDDAAKPTIDYGDDDREGLIHYRRRCSVYRQSGDVRVLIAKAEGSCSSRETKYRWRETKRVCPACSAEAIIKGKKEYGGGWLCFAKKGGCGAKFRDGDAAIEQQTLGRIANPDLGDLENTILKMADKRALVAATLIATGCSDIFTQDIEDGGGDPEVPPREEAPRPAPATRTEAVREQVKAAAAPPLSPAAQQTIARIRTMSAGMSEKEKAEVCARAIGRPSLGARPTEEELDLLHDALGQVLDARRDRGIVSSDETALDEAEAERVTAEPPAAPVAAPAAAPAGPTPVPYMERVKPRTQGLMFRLLGENDLLEEGKRHAFAERLGIVLPLTPQGEKTFSGMAEADALRVIAELEPPMPTDADC